MSARPELTVIHGGTGEVVDHVCQGCVEHSKTISKLSRKITELENEKAEKVHPLDKQIMDVCVFHKRLLSPSWKILRNRGAYNDVKACLGYTDAETGRPAYTPLHLRAASVGMSMDDWCRREGVKAASWLFSDVDRVDRMLSHSIRFKREFGASALSIVDELGRAGYERLAEICEHCGHLRLQHERERPELDLFDPPCAEHGCACPGWSTAPLWEQLRWAAERERDLALEDVA